MNDEKIADTLFTSVKTYLDTRDEKIVGLLNEIRGLLVALDATQQSHARQLRSATEHRANLDNRVKRIERGE